MEQKNVIWAIGLSLLVLFGSQFLIERYFPAPHPAVTTGSTAGGDATAPGSAAIPAAPAAPVFKPRGEALAESPRVAIRSESLLGSISLVGGRLDDLTLARYRETVARDSPQVVLLNPPGTENAYYADFGWLAESGSNLKLPDANTLWSAGGTELTPDQPVTITWDNGQGLTFTRKFEVDRDYMFTVTDSVKNGGTSQVSLYPYARILRFGTPKTAGYYILHEGPIGVFNGSLKDSISYASLAKDGERVFDSTGGWLGFTDKYWLTSLIPTQANAVRARFHHEKTNATDLYQSDFQDAGALALAPGTSASSTTRVFAGAKVVRLLNRYASQLGIPLFERAVDFGWFWFLTEPLFFVLDFLYKLIGNFGFAILALTILVRLLMFPLANKSFRAMNKMKGLTPLMTELRERFKDDKAKLNQEMMELYKREKVNPAAGCLPVVVQIPVFFCLYKTLFVTIEMRHAPFFGWIRDLSAPDPTSWINLFGLLPFAVPHFPYVETISLGVWPILMGVTMFLQQKLNPAPPDPVQAKIFMLLPIVFTFTLARFPAGLVIYWAWNNLLSITQQKFLMWRMSKKS
jgi:YidC/Oxa1 family membrane protein insertase